MTIFLFIYKLKRNWGEIHDQALLERAFSKILNYISISTIFQRKKSIYLKRLMESGSILLDLIIASSIVTLFVTFVIHSSLEARRIFEDAKEKKTNIKYFKENWNVFLDLPIGEKLLLGSSTVSSYLSGNDMKEQLFTIASGSLMFVSTEKIDKSSQINLGGPTICSVDFQERNIQGSYGHIVDITDGQSTRTISNNRIEIKAIYVPVDSSLPLTDLEVRQNTAYITVDSSNASDPDLLVVDISDFTNPVIISNINTGPGLSSFSMAGPWLFASAPSTVGQLHSVHITNRSVLSLVNRYKLPLPQASTTPALGSAIFFADRKIFLGTEKWDGSEFNIIDVSDPANPLFLAGYEIDSKINDIFVNHNIAYVSASNQDQLVILDISDLSNIQKVNDFEPSGYERQQGKTVSFFEDNLILGRTSGGYDIDSDHEVFSWDKLASTSLSGQYSRNIAGGVYGIIQDRSGIFLATRDLDKEFQIYSHDLSQNIANFSLPIAPQAMTCYDNSLYILANRAPFIYKIQFK